MNESREQFQGHSATSKGLLICTVCHRLNSVTENRCVRCNGILNHRKANSVQQCVALLVTSLLLFIPANLYPIMTTDSLGTQSGSTIVGGVLLFLDHGSYGIAVIIFVASVIIPLAKIVALFILCRSTTSKSSLERKDLMRLYRIVEFVGKWSMIDVFVVAILVGLVQLGSLMSIQPGIASLAFCGMVIFTIIAAHKFDPRLIWDRVEQ